MTDDERLAWDTYAAAALGALMAKNATVYMEAERDSHNAAEYADAMLAERRERTGALEERGQDVSDELLATLVGFLGHHGVSSADDAIYRQLRAIQRARAREASSRDDTPERGQDVSVEMLQRAAVACRSAAAMWSAIPTKSEYWCETADYFDKRARAAGKGE